MGNDDEHQRLLGVYFIPCLKANIMSLGQLDEVGCLIYIEHGFLKICDHRQRLLTKVWRTMSRLYILKLKIE
jgi:hypothetical protein